MIYILGERPGKNTDHSVPFYPHTTTGAAARLIRLLNMTTEQYLTNTVRQNCVDDERSIIQGRDRVAEFLEQADGSPFLVMGKSAIKALPTEYRRMKFGNILDNVILIPHTSGVNRFWNDKQDTLAMQKTVLDFLANFNYTF